MGIGTEGELTMHTYKIGDIITREYSIKPMSPASQYRIGAPIPVNEGGETVAMGMVLETTAETYKLQIYRTNGHKRGPSETKA